MHRFLIFTLLLTITFSLSCRRGNSEFVTIALSDSFSTLDTLTSATSDAAAERIRNLMFNSLVKKNEKFEYVGELAKDLTVSEDGTTLTLTLNEGVKFHNGKELTSADVKYTFDELFKSNGFKSGAFFDTVEGKRVEHITALETPAANIVIFKVARPALINQLFSNLVAIPIIAEGTVEQQKSSPVGTGPFKFIVFDQSQNTVELEAFAEYWEGAPKVAKLRVKTVADASALQAELQTGGVDIAPLPTNLPPDTLKALKDSGALNVEQFEGSNIQYVGVNTASDSVKDIKIRQALIYGIDREKLIRELLLGQAKIAHSILPESSWAYSEGTKYSYDPEKAKALLEEAGYKNEPIKFKFSAGNAAANQYAQAIQSSLNSLGFNIQIETLDPGTLREQLRQGQFQLNTGVWVGGNQDPIFLKDLFTTGQIPSATVSCCNRSRYSNSEVDKLVEDAINELDREKAKELYIKAWGIISNEVPLIPLWYPANMVVSNKRISNLKINASGDWSFAKDIEVTN